MAEIILYKDFRAHLTALPAGRHLVAIVGAPGSGKSTLADRLKTSLNAQDPGRAAILPMDGYHFDDRVLDPRGDRDRKGAPHTFDVGGLSHMLKRLKANEEDAIAVPVFDRSIEIARAGAAIIEQQVEIVIVEGNWLLLNAAPWNRLHGLFDITLQIDVPETVLRKRLNGRWQRLGMAPEEIKAKVEGNDLPNARMMIENSASPNFVLKMR